MSFTSGNPITYAPRIATPNNSSMASWYLKMSKWLPIFGLFLCALCAGAQNNRFPPINWYAGVPTGNACTSASPILQSSTTGLFYTCNPNTNLYQAASGSGGSPGGSTYNLQYNNAGSFGGATVSTDSTGANLIVPGATTTSVLDNCLVVDGNTYPRTNVGIQNAVNAVSANGCIRIPNGTYALTATTGQQILITKPISIFCDGWGANLQLQSGAGNVPLIRIAPSGASGYVDYGTMIRGCSFTAATDGLGSWGIEVDTATTGSVANMVLDHDNIGCSQLSYFQCSPAGTGVAGIGFGSGALFFNNPTGSGGYWGIKVKDSTTVGPISMTRAGDHINFENDYFLDHANADTFSIDFLAGSTSFNFDFNNMTIPLHLGNAPEVDFIHDNEFQPDQSTLSGSNGAMLDIDGASGGLATNVHIDNNSFQISANGSNLNAIRLNYSTQAQIGGLGRANSFFMSSGAYEVVATANAFNNYLNHNVYTNTTWATVLNGWTPSNYITQDSIVSPAQPVLSSGNLYGSLGIAFEPVGGANYITDGQAANNIAAVFADTTSALPSSSTVASFYLDYAKSFQAASGGTVDFSASNWLKLPVSAGFTSSANGMCGFDSTNGNYHCYAASVDRILSSFLASATITNGDCVEWLKSGNSVYQGDTGSACGSSGGGVNINVNGGSNLGSPVVLQNSSGAGGITVSNPSGNNVQFALNNTTVAVNGQTFTLGGAAINVNTGAAAHSVALNEGNGNAIAAATIGTAGRMLLDQGAGADPAFEVASGNCTLSSSGAFTCSSGTTTSVSANSTYYCALFAANSSSSQAFDVSSACTLNPSTGNMTITGQMQAATMNTPGDGTHAGMVALAGNTANPSIPTNDFAIAGFNSTSATAYGWQPSTTAPSGTQAMLAGTPSSGWSPITYESLAGSGSGITTGPTSGTTAGHLATFVGTNGQIQDGGAPPSSLPPSGSASGDLAGSYPGPTVNQIEGAAIPISAAVLGTNSSKQLIAATPHQMTLPLACADTSGSGTAQSCSTNPTFAPAKGDWLLYTTTTANTGDMTLNVNSSSAAHVRKWLGAATLASGDLPANTPMLIVYDGTYWELPTIGNAPGGSGTVTSIATSSPIAGGTITSTGTISCPTCLTATSPSAGLAAFSGGGQGMGAATAAQIGTTLNVAQYAELYSNGTSAAPLGLVAPTTNGDWFTGYHITGSAASAPVNEQLVASSTNSIGITITPTYNATGPTQRFEATGTYSGSGASIGSATIPGSALVNAGITATQLAAQYSKGQCTEVWGGTGTSNALQSGDDAISDNTCYNDSGVTRTITAVKCRSDNASNTTTVNPTFGSAGTGTTILSGALTCGNSLAYSSSGTVTNASWTTGTGINPVMGGTLTGTSISMIVEYTY